MEKVIVNKDTCIGCGFCAANVKDVFEINDDNIAESIEQKNIIDNMNEEIKETVLDTVDGCPVGAINIIKL